MEDEKVDLVVTQWNASRGLGTARMLDDQDRIGPGIFFIWTDIVSEGESALRVGSTIYAKLVPDPKHPQTQLKAVEIEIYYEGVPANV